MLLTTLCVVVGVLATFKSLARGILAGFTSLGILADLLKRLDGFALTGVPPIIPPPPPSEVE